MITKLCPPPGHFARFAEPGWATVPLPRPGPARCRRRPPIPNPFGSAARRPGARIRREHRPATRRSPA